MSRSQRFHKVLQTLNRYVIFFLLIAFVITCCMALFITTMTAMMGIELREADIAVAAKLTFGNVVLLSAIVTAIDMVRHKLLVEAPAKRITDAAKQIVSDVHSPAEIRVNAVLSSVDKFYDVYYGAT